MEPNLKDQILKVYIDSASLNSDVANRAFEYFDSSIIEIVEKKPMPDGYLTADTFSQSKRILFITEHKGYFFKRCPGAKPGLACCNYFVLNLGLQCNMNCSYCYLQSYINTPMLTVYSNIDRALNELKEVADQSPDKPFRVGTGETTDSLSLDDMTLYSKKLIRFFKNYPNWKLEFKTKSSKVDQFLDEPHAENVICSWSINPQLIIDNEEHYTASLIQRLDAAKKCFLKGFKISLHIDPMIWHPEWKKSYSDLVDQVAQTFNPKDVIYVTVGALRFQPEQRHMMRDRFGLDSYVTQAEMFQSKDGKMRYDLHIRNEMFDFLKNKFRSLSHDWKLSLCMEVPETWSLTMASTPRQIPEIKELFTPLNTAQ